MGAAIASLRCGVGLPFEEGQQGMEGGERMRRTAGDVEIHREEAVEGGVPSFAYFLDSVPLEHFKNT